MARLAVYWMSTGWAQMTISDCAPHPRGHGRFKMHGVEPEGVDCPAIDGILKEVSDIAGEVADLGAAAGRVSRRRASA